MSISKPYKDPSQIGRKNSPDWLVTIRTGKNVMSYRFNSKDEAQAFIRNWKGKK